MMNNKMYTTQLLDNRNRAHLDQAAELIAQGEIIAFGFNGIFVFTGDADQEIAARRMAAVKQQPFYKTLALTCAPDYLAEFVDLDAPAFRSHTFDKVQRLQREIHSLGVILPAARTGLPSYLTHNGTILNVWFEYPPHHPVRYLQDQIRKHGTRAFIGTSANRHGEPTYVDPLQILRIFGGAIPAIVDYDPCGVPLQHHQSATLIDLMGKFPRLVRNGSVPVEELQVHLNRVGLRQLLIEEPVSQIL